jgi:hypothetical protein
MLLTCYWIRKEAEGHSWMLPEFIQVLGKDGSSRVEEAFCASAKKMLRT